MGGICMRRPLNYEYGGNVLNVEKTNDSKF